MIWNQFLATLASEKDNNSGPYSLLIFSPVYSLRTRPFVIEQARGPKIDHYWACQSNGLEGARKSAYIIKNPCLDPRRKSGQTSVQNFSVTYIPIRAVGRRRATFNRFSLEISIHVWCH